MTPHPNLFTGIARHYLDIPMLEVRRSDSLDFHTVGVWAVAAAPDAAFTAGLRAAAGGEHLDALLAAVTGSDDPAFTSDPVAFRHDRTTAILPATPHHPQPGV